MAAKKYRDMLESTSRLICYLCPPYDRIPFEFPISSKISTSHQAERIKLN